MYLLQRKKKKSQEVWDQAKYHWYAQEHGRCQESLVEGELIWKNSKSSSWSQELWAPAGAELQGSLSDMQSPQPNPRPTESESASNNIQKLFSRGIKINLRSTTLGMAIKYGDWTGTETGIPLSEDTPGGHQSHSYTFQLTPLLLRTWQDYTAPPTPLDVRCGWASSMASEHQCHVSLLGRSFKNQVLLVTQQDSRPWLLPHPGSFLEGLTATNWLAIDWQCEKRRTYIVFKHWDLGTVC